VDESARIAISFYYAVPARDANVPFRRCDFAVAPKATLSCVQHIRHSSRPNHRKLEHSARAFLKQPRIQCSKKTPLKALLLGGVCSNRYKQSLRGYGGLQKFLVARRGASDTSNRLDIAEDGATVSIATTEDVSSSQQEECVTDDRGKEGRTSGGVSVQQGSSVGVLGIGAGAAPAASADTVLSIDGTLVPPATCVAVATASLSLNPSFPHLSCKEPFAKDNGPPATLATEGYSVGYKNRKGRSGGGGTADRKRLPEPGPLSIESLSGVDLLCGDIFQEPW